MKKFYILILTLLLGTFISKAQNVLVLASALDDANVLAIEGMVQDAWAGITTDLVDVAGIADWDEATWSQYDAVVMTEDGGSTAHGKISPIGVKTCPIVCLKAYAIKKSWPSWNLIVSSADTWFQQAKDSSQINYDYTYYGTVAVDHEIFGGYWSVGDDFNWTTSYNENQGDEAHIQCFNLDSSSAPVAAAATMIATNKFAVDETSSSVDGWLWVMDEVPDSSYKKTVIWGVHHMFMDNVTDTFRIILQNSLAWVLGHEMPNVYVNAVKENKANSFDLSVYPNPAISTATLRFKLIQPMNLSLVVRDALGRTVYVQDGIYGAGSQEILLDASSMTPGIYVCQLIGEGHAQSKMLIVE
jgi:hypothetical protein